MPPAFIITGDVPVRFLLFQNSKSTSCASAITNNAGKPIWFIGDYGGGKHWCRWMEKHFLSNKKIFLMKTKSNYFFTTLIIITNFYYCPIFMGVISNRKITINNTRCKCFQLIFYKCHLYFKAIKLFSCNHSWTKLPYLRSYCTRIAGTSRHRTNSGALRTLRSSNDSWRIPRTRLLQRCHQSVAVTPSATALLFGENCRLTGIGRRNYSPRSHRRGNLSAGGVGVYFTKAYNKRKVVTYNFFFESSVILRLQTLMTSSILWMHCRRIS